MNMVRTGAQTLIAAATFLAFGGCGGPEAPAADGPVASASVESAPSDPAGSAPYAATSASKEVEAFVNNVASNEEIPAIVAKVGDIEVTREQYVGAMKTMQRLDAAASIMKQDATERRVPLQPLNAGQKQKILDSYIDGKVVERLIEREGIAVSEEEIEQHMREGRENLMTEENYQNYLKWSQTDENTLKEQVRDQIAQEKYREFVGKDCAVPDDEVAAEYERQIILGKMDRKASVDFWLVLKRVAPGSSEAQWTEARQVIVDAKARVEGGASIEDVAREISDDPAAAENGGFYEKADPGELPQAIGEVMAKLGPEGLSEPVRASYGWVLLKLKERRDAGKYSLEETKDRVRNFLLNRCRQNALVEIVGKTKREMGVEVYYKPLLQIPAQ